jgi:hypothetical protein
MIDIAELTRMIGLPDHEQQTVRAFVDEPGPFTAEQAAEFVHVWKRTNSEGVYEPENLAELERPYIAAARAAALGQGPQPEPARFDPDALPRFTPSLDGRGTEQVDTSGFESGWWTHLHEGDDYSIYWTATGLVLHCMLCEPAEIPLGGHRADLGTVLRAVANHRRTRRH